MGETGQRKSGGGVGRWSAASSDWPQLGRCTSEAREHIGVPLCPEEPHAWEGLGQADRGRATLPRTSCECPVKGRRQDVLLTARPRGSTALPKPTEKTAESPF